MKPAPFEYFAPTTVDRAVGLLDQLRDEDVKLLAGGQSLVPMMNLRLARPTHIVDLNRVDGLDGIGIDDGHVVIGALARHADIEDSAELAEALPLLPHASGHIGYRQIRHRGTLVGSCCHADPVGEWPMITRLLDADFDVAGPNGERSIAGEDFFVSVFTPAVEADEVVTAVRVARPAAPWGWGFSEFARKRGDFAVVAAAAVVEGRDGVVGRARLSLAGAGTTPVRASEAEDSLTGAALDDAGAVARAAGLAARSVEPTDLHRDGAFRRQVIEVEARRALADAMKRARSER